MIQQQNVTMSVYDLTVYGFCRTGEYLSSWENLRRIYLYAMTAHQKSVLRRHEEKVFSE